MGVEGCSPSALWDNDEGILFGSCLLTQFKDNKLNTLISFDITLVDVRYGYARVLWMTL